MPLTPPADGPIPTALIGIGTRAKKLYLPLARAIAPWLDFRAVLSPNPESAGLAAERLAVPAFTDLEALLGSGLVKAAVVLSPIESHHAISVMLSRAGIHHLVETTMASTVRQAEEMLAEARKAGVVLGVAENYFRFPFDRLARTVAETGAIGEVRRITCYHDQVGFHGHARWQRFFEAAPEAVSATAHTMPTARHKESERRIHEAETFRICQLHFPGERIAIDMGGNLKGLLGRTPRPGYTEIAGTSGTIFRGPMGGLSGIAELRCCSSEALMADGKPDHVAPFVDEASAGVWTGSHARLPDGRMARWTNPFRPEAVTGNRLREWDGPVVMELLARFAEEIASTTEPEYSAGDAVMTTRIEMAARESARSGGIAIDPRCDMAGFASEQAAAAAVAEKFGVDPHDVAAMVRHHFPSAF
ncbi:Predicted dehydrogenase [Devosia enhydra]|uniref:Predicted dehydrogenase n=1 Tax=Devosia enhydra TaxID=665118 RepID=A0A1K2I1M8_9HYPH|nr:Gfo/Idh/MocA family oxidoreductase [Devosia enhydra]SFZ85660.1 Predicted dehydrogenase [Devosia enhydra]